MLVLFSVGLFRGTGLHCPFPRQADQARHSMPEMCRADIALVGDTRPFGAVPGEHLGYNAHTT